jgi:hypothetical protein
MAVLISCSCIKSGFFGFDPKAHTATIWDSGDTKFSATNLLIIGLAVVRALAHLVETANRSVYISSFETSLNEILRAYKTATGVDEGKITHVKSDEQIISGMEVKTGSMMAMGKLALASIVKPGIEGDFAEEGLLDNELLGLPRENVEETVARVLGLHS